METLEAGQVQTIWQRPKDQEPLRARMRMGAKGRLVIPAAMREALEIADGQVVDLQVVGGELRIMTTQETIRRVQEWAKQTIPAGVSLADELNAERREAAKHE